MKRVRPGAVVEVVGDGLGALSEAGAAGRGGTGRDAGRRTGGRPRRARTGLTPGPFLEIRSWRTLTSELRTLGVSPDQEHNLRAVGNRLMAPISATRVIALSHPTPGSTWSALTRGSGLARARISRSRRRMGDSTASIRQRRSSTTSCSTAGRSTSARSLRRRRRWPCTPPGAPGAPRIRGPPTTRRASSTHSRPRTPPASPDHTRPAPRRAPPGRSGRSD